MTGPTSNSVQQLLLKYEEASRMPCSAIAIEMDIPISNYYLYRDGRGNPTCRTIDKMIEVVRERHPEILEDFLLSQLKKLRAEISLLQMAGYP